MFLFSKDLITFIISFISLFVIAIAEPLLKVNLFLSYFIPLLTWCSVAFSANSVAAFFTVTSVFTPLFNASTVRSITCGIAASKSGKTYP